MIIPLTFHFPFKYMRYNTIIETNTTCSMKGSIIMKKTYIASAFLMAAMVVSMTGCGNNSSVSENTSAGTSAKSAVSDSDETLEKAAKADKTVSENSASVEVKQLSTTTQESTFTERDLEQTADTSEAESIAVADNKTIDITDAGVYTISGSAENCTIRINADDSAKVQLVLDGVSITNDDFPAIYVLSADKVFITTTDSENTLTVSGEFRADGENNTDAVIYSKDDLVLNGTGTLNVISYYGNGITGKDDMKITGGTYNVKSALDGFEANDSISVCDGTFNVTTKKDGFHCENDEGEGSIAISGGTFTINGASDGIQACAFLQIDGGEFDITAAEGLEATNIVINDGNITINASDDGINGSYKSTSVGTPDIEINGGNLTITMSGSDVDAIDVNGNITVSGGTIDISSPQQGTSGSFDYDGTATYNGGTIIINGQEVSEIPQSMMGGAMRGGMDGGMNGGMGGGFGGGRGGRHSL